MVVWLMQISLHILRAKAEVAIRCRLPQQLHRVYLSYAVRRKITQEDVDPISRSRRISNVPHVRLYENHVRQSVVPRRSIMFSKESCIGNDLFSPMPYFYTGFHTARPKRSFKTVVLVSYVRLQTAMKEAHERGMRTILVLTFP